MCYFGYLRARHVKRRVDDDGAAKHDISKHLDFRAYCLMRLPLMPVAAIPVPEYAARRLDIIHIHDGRRHAAYLRYVDGAYQISSVDARCASRKCSVALAGRRAMKSFRLAAGRVSALMSRRRYCQCRHLKPSGDASKPYATSWECSARTARASFPRSRF